MSTISLDAERAADLVRRYGLTAADLLLEIGSGSGEFLRAARDCGIRVLGVEPDAALHTRAWACGIDTLAAEFTPASAAAIRAKYGPVRLVLAWGVKPGSESFSRLVAAAGHCLAADGAIAILASGVNAVVEVRPDSISRRAA